MNKFVKRSLRAFALINLLNINMLSFCGNRFSIKKDILTTKKNKEEDVNDKKFKIKVKNEKDLHDIDFIESTEFQTCNNQLTGDFIRDDMWTHKITVKKESKNVQIFIPALDDKASDVKTTLKIQNIDIKSAAVSNKKSFIATISKDNTTRIWDSKTGVCLMTASGIIDEIKFTSDGNFIAAGNLSSNLTYLLDSNNNRFGIYNVSPLIVRYVAKSRNGKLITIGCGNTVIVSPVDNDSVYVIECKAIICSLAISHDNKFVAVGLDGGVVEIWNVDGKLFSSLNGHNKEVISLFFTKDNKVITISYDSTIKIWELDGKCLHTLSYKETGKFINATLSNDEKLLITGTSGSVKNPSIDIWDLTNHSHLIKIDGYRGRIQSIKFSKDEKTIITKSDNKKTGTGESRKLKLIHHDNYIKPIKCIGSNYENKIKQINYFDLTLNYLKNN